MVVMVTKTKSELPWTKGKNYIDFNHLWLTIVVREINLFGTAFFVDPFNKGMSIKLFPLLVCCAAYLTSAANTKTSFGVAKLFRNFVNFFISISKSAHV